MALKPVERVCFVRLPAGVLSLAFALLGCHKLVTLVQAAASLKPYVALSTAARCLFQICFGAAGGAVYLLNVNTNNFFRFFGFLRILSGRFMHFLLMSTFVLGTATGCRQKTPTPWWVRRATCWQSSDNMEKLAMVAGWSGLAFSLLLLLLRCIYRHENFGGQELPGSKPWRGPYPMSAVASLGMVIVAIHSCIDAMKKREALIEGLCRASVQEIMKPSAEGMSLYDIAEVFSRTSILLICGGCSLRGSLIDCMDNQLNVLLGFLEQSSVCGLYFLLMGLWQLPLFQEPTDMIVLNQTGYFCAIVSVVVGVVIMFRGSREAKWFWQAE